MSEKYYIGWDDFHRHTKKLAGQIKQAGNFNKIVAVSRGGLLPAGIIAYELDIRNCETINMSSYDNNYDRRPDDKIELHADLSGVDEQTLIIDDLSDSGRTFRILRGMFPKAKFVSVYAKPQGTGEVDIYAEQLPDEWIVFPWDL